MSSYGVYRTKTYIAGDWDGDKVAIQKLYEWKESRWYTLDFVDAHSVTQARDIGGQYSTYRRDNCNFIN